MDDTAQRRQRAEQDLKQRRLKKQLSEKARTHIDEAHRLEEQANIQKMSTEDQMLYHYMVAISTVLEQDYDIFLDRE